MFVKPLIAALDERLNAHLGAIDKSLSRFANVINKNTEDIDSLKRNQARALIGWGIFSIGVPGIMTYLWKRIIK